MKKTKLICTIGPSSSDEEIIKEMILNGMNVARINLAHSDHEFAEDIVKKIRKINKELNTNVGILFDTKGPGIRVGTFKEGFMELENDDVVTLTPEKTNEELKRINMSERKLSLSLDIDDLILLDEGKIELKVIGIKNADITCRVVQGGTLKDNRTLNIPEIELNIDYLSIADKNDILFASKLDIDYIALSYVRCANDILDVNDMLIGERNEHMQIISKIENRSAINDLENIIKVSDGVMVARGDLGVELPMERLPGIQKKIINDTRKKSKICIVSTEMLSSMEEKIRPTRAEVSDVSNAVIDGVDAVTLNGETAIGLYPIESVQMMTKIIEETENTLDYHKLLIERYEEKSFDSTTVISYAAVDAANMLNAKAIVVSTMSGYTARRVSNYRPKSIVVVTTPYKDVAQSLSINWGIIPVVVKKYSTIDEIIETSKEEASKLMDLEKDDKLVITGGIPIKRTRSTNFIKIEEIN